MPIEIGVFILLMAIHFAAWVFLVPMILRRLDKPKSIEQSAQELERVLIPIHYTSKTTFHISIDELGMQSAAYAEHEAPDFIETALERRADVECEGDIPSAFESWANGEGEGKK